MFEKFIAALFAISFVCMAPAFAADKDVGIVLLHGKWDRQPTNVLALARQLETQGFQVVTPTMPWSGNREYDVSYSQALNEVSSAAKELRDKGVKHVVIGDRPSVGCIGVARHAFGAQITVLQGTGRLELRSHLV